MHLTGEQWHLIEPILPPLSPSDRGRPPLDRRSALTRRCHCPFSLRLLRGSASRSQTVGRSYSTCPPSV